MAAALKANRLRAFLEAVRDGKKVIKNTADAKLLLEAICSQDDRARCVTSLMGSEHAALALSTSVNLDVSLEFLNGAGADFINYVTDDIVRQIANGQVFTDLITAIMERPLFWKALRTAFDARQLSPNGLRAYAILVLDLISRSSSSSILASVDILQLAQDCIDPRAGIIRAEEINIRSIGYKIEQAIRDSTSGKTDLDLFLVRPGGRHNNDFEDFRDIAIYPTAEELNSQETPFYLPAQIVQEFEPSVRVAAHLDNQFRLLREDMLYELREDLMVAKGHKKTSRQPFKLRQLQLIGVEWGTPKRSRAIAIALRCWSGFKTLPPDLQLRKTYFSKNPQILKHDAFGCLLANGKILAFAIVDRDVDKLAEAPPVMLLRILGNSALSMVLAAFKTFRQDQIEFVLVGTPFFAYEPILARLQRMSTLPLAGDLLDLNSSSSSSKSNLGLESLAHRIFECQGADLSSVLDIRSGIKLDQSQTDALFAALTKTVSMIQGPPGTGKSFVGALILKALFDNTNERILVLTFKNHALDQTLEDALDMGISKDKMLRLGSKCTAKTEPLSLRDQRGQNNAPRLSRENWSYLQSRISQTNDIGTDVNQNGKIFSRWRPSNQDILDALRFAEDGDEFYDALTVPESSDGFELAGKSGKAVGPTYLIDRWQQGFDAGLFHTRAKQLHSQVWSMSKEEREAKFSDWIGELVREQAELLSSKMQEYTTVQEKLSQVLSANDTALVKTKRVIGCTTTAAAKYASLIDAADPGIVLVEEAAEVLESHVLTALSKNTKQIILIGDHLQLRPKVNNFALTVDKKDGFDLDCSLFERLVLSGYPHSTLVKQHRMRPEISALVRRLMYPHLQDDTKTLNRANMRGLQSNVVFLNHTHFETQATESKSDDGRKASRQNMFEADMVLKTIKYLAQQGYGTEDMVVLTPYLGQLRLLMERLQTESSIDPVLNDIDKHDLVKAGLLSHSGADVNRRPLKMSTIDNFQGEEAKIVVASLTRANDKGDIGFMRSAQRLNVLLSRARDGIVIIGNAQCFKECKKGRLVWGPFFEQLAENGNIYDGLPTQCERHREETAILRTPQEFDTECPEGGCNRPCKVKLNCGKHTCPSRCHQLSDHSKIKCSNIVDEKCLQGHCFTRLCCQASKVCPKCERETKKKEAKRERDHKLAEAREAKEREYEQKLHDIDQELQHCRQLEKDKTDALARDRVLEQRRRDLQQAKNQRDLHITSDATSLETSEVRAASNQNAANIPKTPTNTYQKSSPQAHKVEPNTDENASWAHRMSAAEEDWRFQKQHELASNEYIDSLMAMIGLEQVKRQVLDVKNRIDTCIRQGSSLQGERFGAVFLGNPGTGKTTVARLYARCLASMGVIPGSEFKELTAARLMNGGVAFLQKTIDEILNAEGGAIFIDEAYQLASAMSSGGRQILDFLLPEVENNTGKILFILAGYDKPMEALFAHNEGLRSRFPYELRFHDYEDHELHRIFKQQITSRPSMKPMDAEETLDGIYCRIVARRIGYGRGRPGFGNARAVANKVAKILGTQAERLKRERRLGRTPDDFLLTQEDLIGPEPFSALEGNQSWQKLKSLIGLQAVKESVGGLLQALRSNYQRELKEQPLIEFNLNRVFLGSPGTGKTTVAKLYGQILADIGFLSSGEVVVRNPSDFIGDALGVSEKNTKSILAAASGKVLVIDECYALYSGASSSASSQNDPQRTAVIDTIVAEIQSVPGEDRCVLLLGYKDEMERMFQNVNPGLSRRFPMNDAFVFEDFNDEELKAVLEMKVKQQGYGMSDRASDVAMECLKRARNKPNFGNAGEVDILLNGAKARNQQRCARELTDDGMTLEARDFDPDFERLAQAFSNVRELFKDDIGREDLIEAMEKLQKTVAVMKSHGKDPKEVIPFSYVFTGPPGTGKTSTARKMGQIYFDMGFLQTVEVIETSATDLVGEYVGQTGPKTQKLFEKALGKVLFIDEAYRLAEGHFAKEAMDEIVDCLTKPAFANRLVVILAGYAEDMNRLLSVNPGLSSRFPETILFNNLPPSECIELLAKQLKKKDMFQMTVLEPPQAAFHANMMNRFRDLSGLANWANARDVGLLVKNIMQRRLAAATPSLLDPLRLGEDDVLAALDDLISERRRRQNMGVSRVDVSSMMPPPMRQKHREEESPSEPTVTITREIVSNPPMEERTEQPDAQHTVSEARDPGVSDEVWAQLQSDQGQAARLESEYQELLVKQSKLEEECREDSDSDDAQSEDDENTEARRKLEQQRIQRELVRRELEEAEHRRKAEQEAQRKLRLAGVCCAGFRWIKADGGYRCAGGSHFVSDAKLQSL